jgi:hypothetical protein
MAFTRSERLPQESDSPPRTHLHVEPSTFPAYEFTGYSIDGKPACPFFKELLQRLRPLRDFLCREVPDVGVAEPPFDGGQAAFWDGGKFHRHERPSNRLPNLGAEIFATLSRRPFWVH